ncbi:MAG: GTPase HflX [Lachnospiraceae bacterium]
MERTVKVKEEAEQVIMVGVSVEDGDDAMDSLDELEELLRTAGAEVAGTVLQNREMIHPGTYVGKGKVEEIRRMLAATGADGIVCDDELTSVQYRNLEDLLGVKVMDRTMVILDIFARHAKSSEGKIQVELAQLRYGLSRLTGKGQALSRQGGGIGTRGPGEKKLEVDRRRMKSRISQLKKELRDMVEHRELTRKQRGKKELPVAAIVGYTNAGKSTLLNALTDAGILAQDQLFATLDTTTRLLELPGKQQMLLTDTVGFIRKLPHHLVEAFRSTLEEAKYADYILHVVDASSPQMEKQMYIVYQTLDMLGVRDKKIVTLFNKMDLLEEGEILRDFRADQTICISAKTGQGLEDVRMTLARLLREDKVLVEETFGYDRMQQLAVIRARGEILREEYTPDGVFVKALVPKKWLPEQFCEK